MKDIIDASRYQGTIDWDEFRDKIGGAMLKTVSTNKSLGGIYIDPQFERNYAECKRLGIPVGGGCTTTPMPRTKPPHRRSLQSCGRLSPAERQGQRDFAGERLR